jgi:hypothetical protein
MFIFIWCSWYVQVTRRFQRRSSLNVHRMFTECSLNVHWMFTECSLNVNWMFTGCSLIVRWMFTECSLNVHWMFTEARSAQKLPMVPAVKWFLRGCVSIWRYKHTVPPFCRFLAHLQLIITMEALCNWTRSSTPGKRRLVLLTLVLGIHVCKLCSASTLVLFVSASCSWDGGSRASDQLSLNVHWMFTECSLNVHWMFTGCSLNVHWMFTECSLNVHWMFTECFLNVVHWMFPECSLNVH